jgi:hypothetical protein
MKGRVLKSSCWQLVRRVKSLPCEILLITLPLMRTGAMIPYYLDFVSLNVL